MLIMEKMIMTTMPETCGLGRRIVERGDRMSERERNSQCPICGKYFHHLGLASHRAACRRRKKREIKASKASEIKDVKE